MKNITVIILLACSVLFGAQPETLAVGESFTLDSKIMGEMRTVLVHLPQGYNRVNSRYPVFYLTDGDAQIHHTSGTIEFLARNNRMPQMIVVGVTNTQRTRDLTPTVSGDLGETGGADRFLKFFTDELFPVIDAQYRTQPFRVFSGHSFGGLFSLNAFLKQPDAFNAYISVSPSLWWDDEVMLKRAKEFFANQKELNRTLIITLGDEGERMEKPFKEFKKFLNKQKVKGFSWDMVQLLDEDHGSTVLRSQYSGLKKIFEDWQIPSGSNDLKDLVAHYQNLSDKMGYEINVPEAFVNRLGYTSMGNADIKKAIEIFSWNVKAYPNSANVFDSLGEAFEKSERYTEAHANYEKAWRLGSQNNDPNTPVFKQNMERVGKLIEQAEPDSNRKGI